MFYKLSQIIKKAPKRTIAIVATLLIATIGGIATTAWGPKDRPTYTTTGKLPSTPVLNSITDNPRYGDERNFAHVKESTAANSTYSNEIELKAGKTYTFYVYYHNNASSSYNGTNFDGTGVAKGAYAKVELPSYVLKGERLGSNIYLGASNASPKEVFDNIYFTAATDVTLRYVQNSAVLHNFPESVIDDNTAPALDADLRTFNLPNTLFTTGAAIGYNAMDGILPGCNRYSGYITFQFTAVAPNFEITKEVSVNGSDWKKSATAKIGDEVEYLLSYTNTGQVKQENVTLVDYLPAGLEYIKGSTILTNTNNPDGKVASDGITYTGLNIGTYSPGGNGYISFLAKVTGKDLECGKKNNLVNKARANTQNGSKQDTATLIVEGEPCEEVTPVYTCDSLTVQKLTRTSFKFSNKYTAKDGATYKSTKYIVRDASGKEVSNSTSDTFSTDKVGKYTVEAIVTVTVDGKEKTATSDACKGSFEVTEEEVVNEFCEIPGKEHLPKGDPNCSMPKTGNSSFIGQIIGAVSLTLSAGYYITSRKLRA